MAIFKQGDNSCYFIHIPRTGGRYVSSLFENISNVQCNYHKINTERINNIDITHLHYPLYEYYLKVKDIPHITVIRHPFNKFYSCIKTMRKFHNVDFNKLLETKEKFLEFINVEIEIRSFHNNWFLPQYKFFSPKTHFWKYEWGFGENFKKWVYDKTKIEIKIQPVDYKKFQGETDEEYFLNKKIKGFVEEFYKADYQKFGYYL